MADVAAPRIASGRPSMSEVARSRAFSVREAMDIISRGQYPKSRSTLVNWLGVIRPGLIQTPPTIMLSFHELISLEVLRSLTRHCISLARIRGTLLRLRALLPEVAHPFAHRAFLTGQDGIWDKALVAQFSAGEYLLAISGQMGYREDLVAWWDIANGIRIDPSIRGGQLCIAGTRIPVRSIVAAISAGDPPSDVASAFNLDVEQVDNVLGFTRSWRLSPFASVG